MIKSLALLLALASSAHASWRRLDQTFVHPSKKTTLVIFHVEERPYPDAVFYHGPMGQYLIRDAELFALGHDEPEIQVRYDIYNLRRDGLEYRATSNDRGYITSKWIHPQTVEAIEDVIKRLNARPGKPKLQAADECKARVAAARGDLAQKKARATALGAAETMLGGAIKDPLELAKTVKDLEEARRDADSAQRDCDAGMMFSWYEASQTLNTAEERLERAGNILDWLPATPK